METPDETTNLARAIAPLLAAGDCILLDGELGAGKSHFARAVIETRLAFTDPDESVPSPTFTLVQTYSDGQCEIWHSDLFRLSDPDEVLELGLLEAFDQAVCLVEWANKLGNYKPNNALLVSFAQTGQETERTILISWSADKWAKLVPLLGGLNV